jgi:hypothetical protein
LRLGECGKPANYGRPPDRSQAKASFLPR